VRRKTKVIETPKLTELEQFASWFNQDWYLFFPDFHRGAAMYVANLSAAKRAALHRELATFLQEHAGSSSKALRNRWRKLGAQAAWPRDLDIKTWLTEVAQTV
jgi:hypothetical protein